MQEEAEKQEDDKQELNREMKEEQAHEGKRESDESKVEETTPSSKDESGVLETKQQGDLVAEEEKKGAEEEAPLAKEPATVPRGRKGTTTAPPSSTSSSSSASSVRERHIPFDELDPEKFPPKNIVYAETWTPEQRTELRILLPMLSLADRREEGGDQQSSSRPLGNNTLAIKVTMPPPFRPSRWAFNLLPPSELGASHPVQSGAESKGGEGAEGLSKEGLVLVGGEEAEEVVEELEEEEDDEGNVDFLASLDRFLFVQPRSSSSSSMEEEGGGGARGQGGAKRRRRRLGRTWQRWMRKGELDWRLESRVKRYIKNKMSSEHVAFLPTEQEQDEAEYEAKGGSKKRKRAAPGGGSSLSQEQQAIKQMRSEDVLVIREANHVFKIPRPKRKTRTARYLAFPKPRNIALHVNPRTFVIFIPFYSFFSFAGGTRTSPCCSPPTWRTALSGGTRPASCRTRCSATSRTTCGSRAGRRAASRPAR